MTSLNIAPELERLARLLTQQQATVATAESVTGGLLATWLTERDGSSRFYLGGVSAYAEEVKVRLLGVDPALLARHQAVSEPVVIAMAEGVRALLGTTYGLATTGFAGPTGGTPAAPIGTVWCAVASAPRTLAFKLSLHGTRHDVRAGAARGALLHLLKTVEL